ncbi:hypothetical protein FPV16_10910 [Methylobacterium sp. W2]|uniref:hypothetical protein n=1 Tax=Methylobacterium sp. W2 TaxID=2598107 RepID=UPI001D0C8699|nr:hypothetical protein [Methylobacterium sp. W2]MCC0806728.1 hypothetical protein [Methylobacterium sp. W2]
MESSRRAPVRSHTISLTMLAGFITLSALGTGAAQAQYGYEPDLLLPPRAVVWRLNDRGFTEVTRPRFDGRAYIVEATGPYGDRVRLFVDARDGAVLNRQRLGVPMQPAPVPVTRPAAPGYGWTEADEQPRRPMREAERLVPPGRIPNGDGIGRQPRYDVAVRPESTTRVEPSDRNPLGLNPDARTGEARRPAEAPPARKITRLAPPAKPAAPRLAPESPSPSAPDAASGTRTTTPPVAAIEQPKAEPSTPAANQPRRDAAQAPSAKAQTWSDPPADRKAVRVIGGATVVPGSTDKDQQGDRPAE